MAIKLIKLQTDNFIEVEAATAISPPGSEDEFPCTKAVVDALAGVSGGSPWITFPGTPTRVSDTSFSVTDTGNANYYDKKFFRGSIITWLEDTTRQFAMITGASYSSDAVTFTIVGNSLTAGLTAMKYFNMPAFRENWQFPFVMPTSALGNIGKVWYPKMDILIFGADVRCETAGSGASTVYDINDDGSSIFTSKPTVASGETSTLNTVCDCLLANAVTLVAAESKITIDFDSGPSTPIQDAQIDIFYMPNGWRYFI